jgi:hypothetical protein
VKFPVAKDPNMVTAKTWKVGWWPTFGIIDREGTLRALSVKIEYVPKVVDKLLQEPARKAE